MHDASDDSPMTDRLRLRRPEYTGENRCRACTLVNAVALAALVVAIGAWRPVLALVVALVGVAAIWLRGYLIPYTPRFAPRLVARLPERFAAPFFEHPRRSDTLGDVGSGGIGSHDDGSSGIETGGDGNGDATGGIGASDDRATAGDADGGPDAEAVFEALVSASVLAVDDDRLEPTESFASSWRAEMTRLAERSDAALADAVADGVANAESARIERTGSAVFVVVTGADGSVTWLRRPVALAEIGAVRALAETGVPAEIRPIAAHSLCAFLDVCPACDAELVEGAPDDCCGHTLSGLDGDPPPVLACEGCGVVFYQFE
ncbi:hypothetical protein [Halobellus salinisoli]|uniref:hypothetical protein n=1 Tax=Halobellus salinisoli TaxID=3108500 RepID=UPI003008CC3B